MSDTSSTFAFLLLVGIGQYRNRKFSAETVNRDQIVRVTPEQAEYLTQDDKGDHDDEGNFRPWFKQLEGDGLKYDVDFVQDKEVGERTTAHDPSSVPENKVLDAETAADVTGKATQRSRTRK